MNAPLGTLMLDNAAACRPFDRAAALFAEKSRELFANQESAGALGLVSAKAVEEAGERLASVLAPGFRTFFCGTGTDALRTAVRAALGTGRNGTAVTTAAEHPALLRALERHAGKVLFCRILPSGKIDPESLRGLLAEKPDLLAVHHVNSETGAVQDADFLAEQARSAAVPLLLDTTQSVSKIPLPRISPSFLTVSGCKIGAPCGAALLYDRKYDRAVKRVRFEDHACGRLIPAAAVVLAETAAWNQADLERRTARAAALNRELREMLAEENVIFPVAEKDSSPFVLTMIFPGKEGAVLVRMLGAEGISAASGSACSAETPEPSRSLREMGYSSAEAFGMVRVSFFDDTSRENLVFFANTLKRLLKNY